MADVLKRAYRRVVPLPVREVIWQIRQRALRSKIARPEGSGQDPYPERSAVLAAYAQFRTPKILTLPHDYSVGVPAIDRLDLADATLKELGPEGKNWLSGRLRELGVNVQSYRIDVNAFREYWRAARYEEASPDYYGGNYVLFRTEKALEHLVSAELLRLQPGQVYIDVASSKSVVPEIFHRLFGVKVYRQDLTYPDGIHEDTIGGDAASMPVPDAFADAMALHCSFEQFEGDSDIRFIIEAQRVLKPGGRLCILPLYLSPNYVIGTDPLVAAAESVDLGAEGIIYAVPRYNVRFARFYTPEKFVERVAKHCGDLSLTVYDVTNHREVDPNTYVEYAAVFRKPE